MMEAWNRVSPMNGKQTTKGQITIENLTMAYGDFVVMRDLNFTINRGDIFIIMGVSGCGKSTLMRHMIGLKSPAKGLLVYHGSSLWVASPAEKEHRQRPFFSHYQSVA